MICDLRFTTRLQLGGAVTALVATYCLLPSAFGFEGRINATLTRGGETQTLLYTVGTNQQRIERVETDRPYAKNIIALDEGAVTILFPHNRSYVRLKSSAEGRAGSPLPAVPPGIGPESGAQGIARPTVPQMPPGLGPQSLPGMMSPALPASSPRPAIIGPTNLPGVPAPPPMPQMPAMPQMPPGVGPQAGGPGGAPGMPPMPMMPMMPLEQAELKATDQTTNLLGYTCTRYELKQRGEVMEIWATDKLLPFEPYLQNQPHRFGPRMMEEQWGEMVKAKNLFPLLAVMRFEPPPAPAGATPAPPGPERLRFEVKSITPEKVTDGTLFEPPPDYQEIQPLPF